MRVEPGGSAPRSTGDGVPGTSRDGAPAPSVDFTSRDAARLAALRAALAARRHQLAVVLVLVGVLALGAVTAVVLRWWDEYALVYFGDTASHLVAARKLADWREDLGLERFGTVWLPLPHLLMLPFSLSTGLFSTGLAGTAVSLPSLALTAVLLYKIIKVEVAAPAFVAVAGALLYVLNPNVLYLGVIAMTEAPFVLFFVGAAYFFQRWWRDPARVRLLSAAAALVALATLCRYEGWILPLFLAVSVVVRVHRVALPSRPRAACLALGCLSFAGIALWTGYNAYEFGDPLRFANAEFYSAAAQARTRDVRETLVLQPANIAWVYSVTAFVVYGPVLLSTAAAGLVRVLRERSGGPGVGHLPLLAFLAMPPVFTLTSLLVGIGELSFWFNSRFLVLLGPLLIVLSAGLAQSARRSGSSARRPVVLVLLASLAFSAGTVATDRVPVHLDARGGFDWFVNPYSVQTGHALRSRYDGGGIVVVTGSAQEHRIMITAGIPLGQYDEILSYSTSKESYTEPWRFGRWMILAKAPDSDAVDVVAYWNGRQAELDARYSVAYEDRYYRVLLRREGGAGG